MVTAVDAGGLRAAYISAPLDGVIASLFGPIVNPLKVILGFAEWTVALVDVQPIAEVESAITGDVKSWHATGVASAAVEADQSGIARGIESEAAWLYSNPISIRAKSKVGD